MFFRLVLACAILLALPGTASAAPFAFTGPASVNEAAGTATYAVSCGTTPSVLGEIPNVGALTVTVSDGPPPAATAGEDYGPVGALPTAFTCPPAGASTVEVPILDDMADEVGENFTVRVNGVLLAGLLPVPVDQTVQTTIIDDDPVARIAPVVLVSEADAGTTDALIAVTLASPPVQTTTIKYETQDVSAIAGSDYMATSGDLVFNAGQTSKTISVPIIGDTTPEKPEAFFVNLLSTDNGSLSATAKQGAIGIFDNDRGPFPTLGFAAQSVTVKEGNRGTVNVLFSVTLSSPATERAEVAWKTVDWTANGRDYGRGNGRLVFQPGQRTKTISVDVKGDTRDEPDEAFGVILENPVAAVLGRRGAFGIITDDDGPKVKIGKPKVRGKNLVTKLSCPDTATRCRGNLLAKAGKTRIGRKRFDMLKGTREKVRIRMSRKSRRKLSKRALRAKLIATAADASGAKAKNTRKARLKRLSQ